VAQTLLSVLLMLAPTAAHAQPAAATNRLFAERDQDSI
jgi:hypothetical protein